jgi:predicted DNA-binding transcriptional regulator AlpA
LEKANLEGSLHEVVGRLGKWLTIDEVAEHYRRTPKAIRGWIQRQTGPRPVRLNGRVLFPCEEIEAYDRKLQEQLQEAASQ